MYVWQTGLRDSECSARCFPRQSVGSVESLSSNLVHVSACEDISTCGKHPQIHRRSIERSRVIKPLSSLWRGRGVTWSVGRRKLQVFPLLLRALPTETNVDSGTSQSKSGTYVNSSNSEKTRLERPRPAVLTANTLKTPHRIPGLEQGEPSGVEELPAPGCPRPGEPRATHPRRAGIRCSASRIRCSPRTRRPTCAPPSRASVPRGAIALSSSRLPSSLPLPCSISGALG